MKSQGEKFRWDREIALDIGYIGDFYSQAKKGKPIKEDTYYNDKFVRTKQMPQSPYTKEKRIVENRYLLRIRPKENQIEMYSLFGVLKEQFQGHPFPKITA